jgi:hypothetical protein
MKRSLILSKEHKSKEFGNRVLRKIFAPILWLQREVSHRTTTSTHSLSYYVSPLEYFPTVPGSHSTHTNVCSSNLQYRHALWASSYRPERAGGEHNSRHRVGSLKHCHSHCKWDKFLWPQYDKDEASEFMQVIWYCCNNKIQEATKS